MAGNGLFWDVGQTSSSKNRTGWYDPIFYQRYFRGLTMQFWTLINDSLWFQHPDIRYHVIKWNVSKNTLLPEWTEFLPTSCSQSHHYMTFQEAPFVGICFTEDTRLQAMLQPKPMQRLTGLIRRGVVTTVSPFSQPKGWLNNNFKQITYLHTWK